jgi:hypothetical protein
MLNKDYKKLLNETTHLAKKMYKVYDFYFNMDTQQFIPFTYKDSKYYKARMAEEAKKNKDLLKDDPLRVHETIPKPSTVSTPMGTR